MGVSHCSHPTSPMMLGATVAITHRIRSDKHAKYENWLNQIAPLSKTSLGFLDWHVVRPIAGLTETYTVIFASTQRKILKTG